MRSRSFTTVAFRTFIENADGTTGSISKAIVDCANPGQAHDVQLALSKIPQVHAALCRTAYDVWGKRVYLTEQESDTLID